MKENQKRLREEVNAKIPGYVEFIDDLADLVLKHHKNGLGLSTRNVLIGIMQMAANVSRGAKMTDEDIVKTARMYVLAATSDPNGDETLLTKN